MKDFLALTLLGLLCLFSPTLLAAAPLQPPYEITKGKELADRDADALSDALQLRLATLSPSEPVTVVVTFAAPGSAEAAQHAVGPFRVKREFRIINGFSATMTAAQARSLSRVPGVFRVEEDFYVTTMLDAANRDFGVDAARSSYAVTGDGIGICVVDTGVDPAHEQLDAGKVAGFVDFINKRTTAYDDHGHGTHVAAIAAGDGIGGANAATYMGVAPGAQIYATKVLDAQGSGSESDVIAGVEWCADLPEVRIISMSLGSDGSSDGKDALSLAVNAAVEKMNKVVVVAAGNSGDGPATIGSPGAALQAITVGAVAEWSAPATAVNHSDGAFLAWFSSRGPTADGRVKPDIISPGVTVTSARAGTNNGYITWSGTSMATPFVAGSVALALEKTSSLTPSTVKNSLLDSAQDRGAAGVDNDWGTGLIDVKAFLSKVSGLSNDPIPFPTWQRLTGSVTDNGLWIGHIEVNDTTLPLAVTLTITGQPECSFWFLPNICLAYEWSPDLDAEIVAPDGTTVLRSSTCPNGTECGSMGRQETLHLLPPNNGKGGSFSLDISTGPLAGSEPPVLVNAGVPSLTTGTYSTSGKGAKKTTSYITTSTFTAGQEIVFNGTVMSKDSPVSGAVVTLKIADSNSTLLTLTGTPSDADGVFTARWQTVASKNKVVTGTPTGTYTATVNRVLATGYTWNGTETKTSFVINK